MSSTWSKLKKSLSFKSSAASPASLTRMSTQSESGSAPPQLPSSTTTSSSLSLSSRFSRSFSSISRSSKKTCAICLGNLRAGQGQAIFTAECSHSFHFTCIANSVKHGNYLCPICRFKWKEIPFQLPDANLDLNRNAPGRARTSVYRTPFTEPARYSDDEPLDVAVPTDPTIDAPFVPSNIVTVKTFTEFPAIAASESVPKFAVLVSVHAPPLLDDARQVERAPIDLVMVLDGSGSMSGSKLILLKSAACFVIENLGPADRLSIVLFSASAKRIFPLRRMTDRGREDAKVAVASLYADGGTNIVAGLRKGAQVLEERREKNPVASIILLSDGKDTCNHERGRPYQASSNLTQFRPFLRQLPVCISSLHREARNEDTVSPIFPVHTFGFGLDHDSSIMHVISDASGGTFSFIESVDMVQDAFARCIGGLLSVVAQDFRLSVTSSSSGVKICSIPSGSYVNEISEQRLEGTINIGDLYADEEKKFLVYLSVPASGDGGHKKMALLRIEYSYKDVLEATLQFEGERVEIWRPVTLSPTDSAVSLEVDLERNRLLVAESIAEAKEKAESGDLEGAQNVLKDCKSALLSSASGQAGDGLCRSLEVEITEIRERMVNKEMYEQMGRAYVLAGLSSHSWQRATTRGDTAILETNGSSSHSGSVGYNTPSMMTMVMKSQNLSITTTREDVTQRFNKEKSAGF